MNSQGARIPTLNGHIDHIVMMSTFNGHINHKVISSAITILKCQTLIIISFLLVLALVSLVFLLFLSFLLLFTAGR